LIREKEDELKNLKRIYADHLKEKESIDTIKKKQMKALGGLRYTEEEENQKKEIYVELRELKNQNKHLHDQRTALDKDLSKNHQKIVNSKMYVRSLHKKLEEYKKKSDGHDYANIKEGDLVEMESKIEDLNSKIKDQKKNQVDRLRGLEKQKKDQMDENGKLEAQLKLKDKVIRLNTLKMNELKRLQRHKALKLTKANNQANYDAQRDAQLGISGGRDDGARDQSLGNIDGGDGGNFEYVAEGDKEDAELYKGLGNSGNSGDDGPQIDENNIDDIMDKVSDT
jgi:hypothetical protein